MRGQRDLRVLLRGRADLDDLPPKCACRRGGTGRCHLSCSRVAGGREGRQARHSCSVFSSVSARSYLPALPVTNPIEYPPSVLVAT